MLDRPLLQVQLLTAVSFCYQSKEGYSKRGKSRGAVKAALGFSWQLLLRYACWAVETGSGQLSYAASTAYAAACASVPEV